MSATKIDQQRRPTDEREDDHLIPRPKWEQVECTCPDFCERDHERD